jgi:ABC-type lipoprotein release transport system permease subunit
LFRPVNALFRWEILRLEFKGIGESRRQFFAVLPFWLIFAVSTTILMMAVQSGSVAELGTEFVGVDNHKTIVLEQDKWAGKEFPLHYLMLRTDLAFDFPYFVPSGFYSG